LFRWTLDPSAAAEAVAILNSNPNAAMGWGDSLGAMIDADPKTRDSIWQGVSLALAALADPRVLDAVTPGPNEHFDPETFLTQHGTLYLLAAGAGAGASAALVAAFVEDLIETARRLAARSPGARLDPPLLLALDEIGNLAPLPSLPTLMAEGGGTGITTMPVLQSLAQARDRWSEHQAGAIWDASIVKIILGGASNSRDLQDLSTLIGERDEYTDSLTLGDRGTRSNQRSVRRVPILPPDRIRTLPFGTGITLLRSAPPIVTDLRAWPDRPDSAQLRNDRTELEALLRRPHAFGQGAVIWVFISEIFPNRIRGRGQGLGSLTHWVFAAITSFAFPPIIGALGGGPAFGIFAVCMIGQMFWVLKYMPETKGVPLEEMEHKLGLVHDPSDAGGPPVRGAH